MLFLSWLDILKQAHINYLCSQTFIDINWMFSSVVVVQAHVAEHTLCGNQMKHRDRTTHNIMHPTSLISLLIICIQDPRRRTNILQRGGVHVATNSMKTSKWQNLDPPPFHLEMCVTSSRRMRIMLDTSIRESWSLRRGRDCLSILKFKIEFHVWEKLAYNYSDYWNLS